MEENVFHLVSLILYQKNQMPQNHLHKLLQEYQEEVPEVKELQMMNQKKKKKKKEENKKKKKFKMPVVLIYIVMILQKTLNSKEKLINNSASIVQKDVGTLHSWLLDHKSITRLVLFVKLVSTMVKSLTKREENFWLF